jgi:hypothetical protein
MTDYKNLFGYAAILFAVGFVIRSIAVAYAVPSGPSVSYGNIPYQSFAGSLSANTYADLLIIPSDQIFIVTSCISSTYNSDQYGILYEDATNKSGAGCYSEGALRNGHAHVVIQPGTTLKLKNNHYSYTTHYYVEGYYAHP